MELVLNTPCGTVRGLHLENGAHAYRGIHYATAGRWEYPQVVTHWDGVYDATQYGPAAMQQNAFVPEPENGRPPFYYHEFRENISYTYSEDCQCLNIFTFEQAKKAPVIVYIHGGAFLGGSSREKPFDVPGWPQMGAVAVTVNYRLGLLGFASLDELCDEAGHTGNYGLYDQLTALEWVKNNIAAFGGDPENITLMGQSAGARSVQMLVGSPRARGLVHRAVMSSGGGVPSGLFPKADTRQEVRRFWQEWQRCCGAGNVNELRALPVKTLFDSFGQMFSKGYTQVVQAVSPQYDDAAFPLPGSAPELPDGWLEIPYLCGGNSEDLLKTLHLDALAWAAKQACASYAYYFSRQLPGDASGAFHSADLWYWFGTLEHCWRPFEARDHALAREMVGYLINFAHTGNPNGADLPCWEKATARGECLQLGNDTTQMDMLSLSTM